MLFISPAITANLKTFRFGISACCGVDYRATRCHLPPQRSRRRPRSHHAGKPKPPLPPTLATERRPRCQETMLSCSDSSKALSRPPSRQSWGCHRVPRHAETRPSRACWLHAPHGMGKGDPRAPLRCPQPQAANALRGAVLGAPTGTGTPALLLPRALHRLQLREATRRLRSRKRKLQSSLLSQPRWLIKSLGRIKAPAGEGSASPDGLLTGGDQRLHRDLS